MIGRDRGIGKRCDARPRNVASKTKKPKGRASHRVTSGAIAALVERDMAQPGLEWPLGIETGKRAPGRYEALLQDIIGVIAIRDVAADELVQPALVPPHQRGECGLIALASRDRQGRVWQIGRSRHGRGEAVAVNTSRTLRS